MSSGGAPAESTPAAAVADATTSAAAVDLPQHSAKIPKVPVNFTRLVNKFVVIDNVRSHNVVIVRECEKCKFLVRMNQRLATIVLLNCRFCTFKLLDSAVVTSRTCKILNCTDCEFVFEDIDTRKVECFDVSASRFAFIGDTVLLENQVVIWRPGCTKNVIATAEISQCETIDIEYQVERGWFTLPASTPGFQFVSTIDSARRLHTFPLNTETSTPKAPPQVSITTDASVPPISTELAVGDAEQALLRIAPFTSGPLATCRDSSGELLSSEQAYNTLLTSGRSTEILAALDLLFSAPPLTEEVVEQAYHQERQEYLEPVESLREKARQVADLISSSKHTVVYSGAGISTSSGIGDFRGPQGLWTCQDTGRKCVSKSYEDVDPTFSHYAITTLAKKGLVNFVVTTNVDGLHLRSGTPLHLLVEMHGCCYKEVCSKCKKVILRDYDVFPGRMSGHKTGQRCDFCTGPLLDTSVAFGETYRDQMDAVRAAYHARKSTLAIILGTSMNVQSAASYPEKVLENQGQIVLVNMQATPYDAICNVRVWARIDDFMRLVMQHLNLEVQCTFDARNSWGDQDD
ncbi:silent information regulator family protein [Pelomyxa schiedti]|nr:silent information regulator family protein [Pelomyxa schiedti]